MTTPMNMPKWTGERQGHNPTHKKIKELRNAGSRKHIYQGEYTHLLSNTKWSTLKTYKTVML